MGIIAVKDDWRCSQFNLRKPVTSHLEMKKPGRCVVTWDATQLELGGLIRFSKMSRKRYIIIDDVHKLSIF